MKRTSHFFSTLILVALSAQSIANATPVGRSDLPGLKWPNTSEEGTEPVETYAESTESLTGFTELIPYSLATPDQEDAGSCLYMSLTGIAEWWLAKLRPELSRELDGPLDLSERQLMNLAGISEDQNGVKNWKTDSIYLYNSKRLALLNKNYRFTKNWHVTNQHGDLVPATRYTRGAVYDSSFNWINQLKIAPNPNVQLPTFERDVIFADPESNQWNVAVMPSDIVEKVKEKLESRKAPVHVIYNHYGYWHAVNIIGFDDEMKKNNCQFVSKFEIYMEEEPKKLRKQAAQTSNPAEQEKLLARALKFENTKKKFSAAYKQGGGCGDKGMFYVRDSIYPDESKPYDYDLNQPGTEGFYSKPVIVREYEWLTYMANHATQVYVR